MNKWMKIFFRIRIHPLSWLVVATAVATARFRELLILFLLVSIHELGHAAAASFFSWRIKQITLLPFGGVLEVEEHGNRPLTEELIVTIAGPLQHIWLFVPGYFLYATEIIPSTIFHEFLAFNMMILLFNCLPVLPLDGGKLLYLYFSANYPFHVALKNSILCSLFFLFLYCCMILLIFPYHLNGWVIVLFLLFSLYKEWKNRPYVWMRFLLERYGTKNSPQAPLKTIDANKEDTVRSVVENFYRGMVHQISVYEQGKKVGTIDEKKILQAFFKSSAGQITLKDLPYFK